MRWFRKSAYKSQLPFNDWSQRLNYCDVEFKCVLSHHWKRALDDSAIRNVYLINFWVKMKLCFLSINTTRRKGDVPEHCMNMKSSASLCKCRVVRCFRYSGQPRSNWCVIQDDNRPVYVQMDRLNLRQWIIVMLLDSWIADSMESAWKLIKIRSGMVGWVDEWPFHVNSTVKRRKSSRSRNAWQMPHTFIVHNDGHDLATLFIFRIIIPLLCLCFMKNFAILNTPAHAYIAFLPYSNNEGGFEEGAVFLV